MYSRLAIIKLCANNIRKLYDVKSHIMIMILSRNIFGAHIYGNVQGALANPWAHSPQSVRYLSFKTSAPYMQHSPAEAITEIFHGKHQ